MKKIISLILALAMVMTMLTFIGVGSSADSAPCGDAAVYSFDAQTGTLTISGTGATENYAAGKQPWISEMNLIKSVVIGEGITDIGDRLFDGASALESAELPKSLTTIGKMTFQNSGLKSVVIPENVIAIGAGAFKGCASIESVVLNEALESLGIQVFLGCAFKSIYVYEKLTDIGSAAIGYKTTKDKVEGFVLYAVEESPAIQWAVKNNIAYEIFVPDVASGEFESGAKWVVYDDGVLAITGNGSMDLVKGEEIPWEEHNDLINELKIGSGVSNICPLAFRGKDFSAISVEDSGYFVYADGAIYSKDMTKLVCLFEGNAVDTEVIGSYAVCGGKDYRVPNSVKTIEDNAIGYDENGEKIADFIITADPASCAKDYAEKNGFTFMPVVKYTDSKTGICIEAIGDEFIGADIKVSDVTNESDDIKADISDAVVYNLDLGVSSDAEYIISVPLPEGMGEKASIAVVNETGYLKLNTVNDGKTLTAKTNVKGKMIITECSISLVNFYSEDGETLYQSVTVLNGARPVYTGEPPIKEADETAKYVFYGWGADLDDIKGDTDLYAHFMALPSDKKVTYVNGDVILYETTVEHGAPVNYVGAIPTKESVGSVNYAFECWQSDSGCDEDCITEATVFSPVFKQIYNNPFKDIDPTNWYGDAVEYVVTRGLMSGMSPTTFEPQTQTSRGMLVTVLYNIQGRPNVTEVEAPFTDIGQTWYTDAVKWAYSENIVSGMSETVFAPNDIITREQFAVILYNYAKFCDRDVSELDAFERFDDSGDTSAWAFTAMRWAVKAGYITGMSETILSPRTGSTRAQMASILMRYLSDGE